MNSQHREGEPRLILASGSRYRRSLLERLGLPFTCDSPDIDETRREGEEPAQLATRLASEKALAVAARHPGSVVIGSDQVATLDGRVLGKPGTAELAARQLTDCSGRAVEFLTGVCVIDGRVERPEPDLHMDITRVQFRALEQEEILRYVERDAPLDCAGGFKSEGLGIALFERIDSLDPTGLVGLPMIWLSRKLIQLGFAVL
jgi:septum formation protein